MIKPQKHLLRYVFCVFRAANPAGDRPHDSLSIGNRDSIESSVITCLCHPNMLEFNQHSISGPSVPCDHLPPYVKSSNNVTLSALVHTPTLPASLNVASFHSMAFFPSNATVKRLS